MVSLGLEAVEVVGDGELPGERWKRTEDLAHFVRFVSEGVILRQVMKDELGEVIRDQVEGADGFPEWHIRYGREFLVRDDEADYRPSGVSLGRRKRWREPGGVEG